jgi:integrase
VFAHPDGRPYNPDRFSREFDRALARHPELPRFRLHDLRHGWATIALQAGVAAKIVSERPGHATTAITLDTYSHVSPTMGTDAAEKVAGLIFGGAVTNS